MRVLNFKVQNLEKKNKSPTLNFKVNKIRHLTSRLKNIDNDFKGDSKRWSGPMDHNIIMPSLKKVHVLCKPSVDVTRGVWWVDGLLADVLSSKHLKPRISIAAFLSFCGLWHGNGEIVRCVGL